MSNRSVINSSFTVEREYAASPALVFAAWADPKTKARWFGGDSSEHHELDFQVGGREVVRGRNSEGRVLTFESHYHDIIDGERIVYSATLLVEDMPVTVSLTTVQFEAVGAGTSLVLTEQDSFLDGHEKPEWRERGTNDQLTALGAELPLATTP